MKEIISIINELRSTTKTNEKLAILKSNEDCELLKKVLYYTYNPNFQFGFSEKKLRELLSSYETRFVLTYKDGFEMLDVLSTSNINDELRGLVLEFLSVQNEEVRELWINIICKDIRANISDKTINKVWKGLIPTWEIQQGRPIEKAPLKKGERFILSTKANGINCSYYRGKLISRQGKEFVGLEHIIQQIEELGLQDMFINGELVRDNINNVSNEENFRLTASIVNSDTETKPEINFTIFDMLPSNEFDNNDCKLKYGERVANIKSLENKIKELNINNIKIIHFYYDGTDQSMVDYYLDIAVENDEEGLMAIPYNALYTRKRSNNVKKVKRFYTVDLKVIGREIGTGKLSDTLGALVVDYKGNPVGLGSGFTDLERDSIWAMGDDIIGKIVEVKYKEITKDKKTGKESLQFPVFKCIKTDKTEPSYN